MIKILSSLSIILAISISCTNTDSKSRSKAEDSAVSNSQNKAINISKENDHQLSVNADTANMIYFPGGKIIVGASAGSKQHQPPFEIEIKPFFLDIYPVSVAQFNEFVQATGYISEAEKFGDSGIFDFSNGTWDLVKGAYWKYPLGPDKAVADPAHPVTHVSWNDATAYANWAGKRLPNEFEWEYAAKNGKSEAATFPWGMNETIDGTYMANTWQGPSATEAVIEDGYLITSPVGTYPPAKSGLFDMAGNVWEWCSNTFKPYPGSTFMINIDENVKAIRGGSFMYDQLGAESYSVYGRSFNTTETSLFNTGFRCAK